MMKRLLALCAAVLMLVGLCLGCQPEQQPGTAPESSTATTTASSAQGSDPTDPATPTDPEAPTVPTAPGETTVPTSGQPTVTTVPPVGSKNNITLVAPAAGSTLSLGHDVVEEWLADRAPGSSGFFCTGEDRYHLKDCTLKWTCAGKPQYFNVRVATKKDFSDAVNFVTNQCELPLEEPYTGVTYYWQVTARYADKQVISEVFSFSVAKTPRTVRIDGVSNSRDIGGVLTADGKRIKRGMFYRAALLDNVTPEGQRQALALLGIKSDFDLRNGGEGTAGQGESPLGREVNYIHRAGAHYDGGSMGIDTVTGKGSFAREFKVLADPANYPLIAHCSVGRDRTGTLVFVLQALLGVSLEDAYIEYELSFLSEGGSAGQEYESPSNGFVGGIDRIHKYLTTDYPADTLAESTEKYLLDIGVTQAEIDSIRNILLEEVN